MESAAVKFDVPTVDEHRGISQMWALLRLALAGLWLIAAVAGYLVHERPATLEDLYASVAAGDVTSVRLVGGLPPGATGFAGLEAHWHSDGVARVAKIKVVRAGDAGEAAVIPDGAHTKDDVAREISVRDSSVQVVQTDAPSGITFAPSILGWTVPGWAASLVFGVWLVSLYVLAAGPEPWRATRWAWFWLGASPVGLVAFLLFSGPTPALPAPRDTGRRLTGGWAFLLGAALPR